MRLLLIILVALYILPVSADDYIPPIGIPAPEFGINESHMMYMGAQYDFGNGLEDYKDAGNGPYTHYVDNSEGSNCSNNQSEYGSESVPRCSLSKREGVYAAGSVIELHGGPYDYSGFQVIIANGTRSNPVFIRGINNGETRVRYLNTNLRIAGEYLIIENLELYTRSAASISPFWDTQGRSSFIAFRNSEVHKPIGVIGSSSAVFAGGDDIVIYNNALHHNVRSETQDAQGVVVTEGSNRVWILENDIYKNSGNGIGACHGCSTSPPRYIYIGKNTIHEDRELGIGLKYARDVIISQNKIWGYPGASTADAAGIIVGADGATERVWVLFNEIYDSLNAIRVEETPTDVWIIGNVIYNIERFGVGLEKEARDAYILNNTFDNVGEGINQSSRRFILFKAFNNIFSNIGTYPFYVQHRDVSSVSTASNNLFFQNGSSFPILWSPSDGNYTTTTDLTNFPGGINNIVADPDLLLPSYAIGSNSGAINAGSMTGDAVFPYTQFEDLYGGISIRFDYNGVARPLSSQWDIGAIEFNPGFIFTNGFE